MNSDQVADTSTLNVNGSSSTIDLNGFSDTVGAVSMTGGTIATGSGTLHLAGNVTSAASAATATISGNVDLGAVTRVFTVADGTPADDLVVSGNIYGTGGINKMGNGMLALTGNNSFAGGITISAGSVRSSGGTMLAGAVPLDVATGT